MSFWYSAVRSGTKGRGVEMKQIGTCKIHFLSEAVAPVTHMGGVSGNEAVLNREKVVHGNKVADVPVLSGNALRHKLIREPGAMHLVDVCGLRGELNIDQANFMFTGGSLTESATSDNIPLISEMQSVSPLFRLLGGSLRNQVVGGSLYVSRGILACEENRTTIEKMCPVALDGLDNMLPAQSFVSSRQYTRGDAAHMKDADEIIDDIEDAKDSNLMIYSGESVIQGAVFYHNMTLYNVSSLEAGAALNAVHRWYNSGSTIGGSARIGHGELDTVIMSDGLVDWFGSLKDPAELVADYCKHAEENADAFKLWLNKAFPDKGQKKLTAKKPKKGEQVDTDGVF